MGSDGLVSAGRELVIDDESVFFSVRGIPKNLKRDKRDELRRCAGW